MLLSTWAMVRRELMALFLTPLVYVVFALFQAFSGWMFYISVSRYGALGPDTVFRQTFGAVGFISWIVLPLITMRLLAEERKTGTLEMLMTAPVGATGIALAKFISGLLFYLFLLSPTLLFVFLIGWISPVQPDAGPIVGAYIGLVLLSGAFIAIGLFVSALTQNQIVAALMTFVVFMGFWVVDMLSNVSMLESSAQFFHLLSFEVQFSDFAKGVIDGSSVVYFLTVWIAGLFLTVQALEMRRWR